jgi:hypothetical protein
VSGASLSIWPWIGGIEMSRIASLSPGKRNVRVHQTSSDCEFQILEDADGELYLQVSTFGSDRRRTEGVTQTMQFDKVVAAQLIEILKDVFENPEASGQDS